MKALKNHLILFDAECPMCSLYTNALVKTSMLKKDERVAYQDVSDQTCPTVDRQRAVNEIALVNLETGEVTYGIRSLFKIFAVAFPLFKPLFLFEPFVWAMGKVYSFIAFNRRVIVPPPSLGNQFALQPSFRLDYRIAYLFFTWAVTAYIFSLYINVMDVRSSDGAAYLICGGLILFQGIIVSILSVGKLWDYLGNMMTILFAGALLLLPVLLISIGVELDFAFLIGYFMVVDILMLLEHIHRINLLKLSQALTVSWVFYQVAIVLIILSGFI